MSAPMPGPSLLSAALPTALAFTRLVPLALWASRAGAWLFPGAVAWSAALALSVFFGALAPAALAQPGTPGAWLRLLAGELGTGAVLCFVVAAPFAALRFAAAGLGRALGGPPVQPVARLLGLGAAALLVSLALQRAVVRLVAVCFARVPLARPLVLARALDALLGVAAHAAFLAITLLLPFLCALLFLDVAFALGARWSGDGEAQVAQLPLRVSLLALSLGSAIYAFAERVPGLLRGAFALLDGVLTRLLP